jgi:hypothetical protein
MSKAVKVTLTSALQAILLKHPQLRTLARKARFALWRGRFALRARMHGLFLDPLRVLWVDPKKIEYIGIAWGDYDKLRNFGKVVGGDWDLNRAPFEHLDVYRALKARYVDGVPWHETSYFRSLLDQLNSGRNPYRIQSKHDLEDYLAGVDRLFDEIQHAGYRTQSECQGTRSLSSLDDVTVRIARTGEFLFEDGRHRLAIAKILALPQIPVRVTWRHREWYLFRLQILDYARRHGGKLYQPITHPDLSDIPAAHEDIRFRLIKSSLPLKGGTLLDIGANWGYFCHRF